MADILGVIDHIGNSGTTDGHYTVQFTPYTGGQLDDGEAMVNFQTVPNAFRYNGGTSTLKSVTLIASDTGAGSVVTKDVQIWLFGKQGQTAIPGSAFTMNTTSVRSYYLQGVVNIDSAEYTQSDDIAVAKKDVSIKCANYDDPESQSVYALFVFKDAAGLTYASTARYDCIFVFEHN